MTGDSLERLWTPHRLEYIKTGGPKPDGCPFCAPDENLVVARGETAFVILNLFPYNPGHLLVCPYRHVSAYVDLTADETVEVATLTQAAMRAVQATSQAPGFNVGMNLGAVAGAGIAAHLHQHVLPRWGGDTNFMPLLAGTKTMPELLEQTRDLLRKAWV